MNLYKISQNINNGYDTYSDAIVCAEDEEQAKRIHPSTTWFNRGYYDEEKKEFWTTNVNGLKYKYEDRFGSWTNDLNEIKVEYIGEADDSIEKGVVCASYHAG